MRLGLSNVVGIPGVNLVDDLLREVAEMERDQSLVLMLDPGVEQQVRELAKMCMMLGVDTMVTDPFIKPDDMALKHGIGVVNSVIRQSRRVRI